MAIDPTSRSTTTGITFCSFLLLLWLFAYAALAQVKPSRTFTLTGQGLPSTTGTVYLFKQNDVPIDSARIRQGSFTVKGALTDPDLYWIKLSTADRRYPVFLEAAPIRITFAENATAKVSGSKMHDQWETYVSKVVDPTTFLIDQSGKIQGDNLHGEELTKKVAGLPGEKR